MSRPDKVELAARVWRRLFDFIIETRSHRDKALEKHGLTPNDSRALFTLDRKVGRTMQSLAKAWACDPSNATWVVDRLERAGLAERKVHLADRRVKLVVLTPTGARVRAQLEKELYEPPDELLALGRDELEQLAATVEILAPKR
jgi:DNA-binding MarR family transcriptional regulator